MLQDLRYGMRMLIKNKALTIMAVLSLALGIGANTAIFSLLDVLLLREMPVRQPERLVFFGRCDGPAGNEDAERGHAALPKPSASICYL